MFLTTVHRFAGAPASSDSACGSLPSNAGDSSTTSSSGAGSQSSSPKQAGASDKQAPPPPTAAPNKRKKIAVDLDTISDPEERKRQKRLAKNRRTAAVSRDRKRAQMELLQDKLDALQEHTQQLNAALAKKDQEIARLAGMLSSSITNPAVGSPGSVAESAYAIISNLMRPLARPSRANLPSCLAKTLLTSFGSAALAVSCFLDCP